MKSALRLILLLGLAAVSGLCVGALLYELPAARAAIARCCGLENEMSLVRQNLQTASRDEPLADEEIDRQLDLLRDQFGDEKLFAEAIASSALSLGTLRAEVADHLRAGKWLEKQIAPQLGVSEEEVREFYRAHPNQFRQPQRYRATHLFLAAPEGSSPEVILTKQSAIQGLAVRVLAGEPVAQLAAEASEDEATKLRRGDLGYFAAARMPPEFFAEVEKLQTGQISAPIQSHLGFHIVHLTDSKPPHEMSFEEAHPEIMRELANEKRRAAIAQLKDRLANAR